MIPTHNGLLGRYPGADGMKTGFVCPSGFNVVASATRNGRHIVVVVMGSPNARSRTIKAANLFDLGFGTYSFLRKADLSSLPEVGGTPPNMRQDICGRHRKVVQEDDLAVVQPAASVDDNPAAARAIALGSRPVFEPVEVFVGRKPDWTGPVAMARTAPVSASPNARAYAPHQGIGATASRAIPVKSAAKKPAAKQAALHAAPDAKRLKEDKAKTAARDKARANMTVAQKTDLAGKAKIAGKPAANGKAQPKKITSQKPEPAKTAKGTKATDQEKEKTP